MHSSALSSLLSSPLVSSHHVFAILCSLLISSPPLSSALSSVLSSELSSPLVSSRLLSSPLRCPRLTSHLVAAALLCALLCALLFAILSSRHRRPPLRYSLLSSPLLNSRLLFAVLCSLLISSPPLSSALSSPLVASRRRRSSLRYPLHSRLLCALLCALLFAILSSRLFSSPLVSSLLSPALSSPLVSSHHRRPPLRYPLLSSPLVTSRLLSSTLVSSLLSCAHSSSRRRRSPLRYPLLTSPLVAAALLCAILCALVSSALSSRRRRCSPPPSSSSLRQTTGRCPFRQYMPSKPAKYGIKSWVARDAKSSYAWKLQVYTGKPNGGRPEKDLGLRVALDVTEGLTGRNVTCDNFFTSYELGRRLLLRDNTVVGTVRKNRREVPAELLASRRRAVQSSRFAFAPAATLVSYLPKKGRNVLLLSTRHARGDVSDRPDAKPVIVLDYNRNKGGVDNLDKVTGAYSCRRMTARWPLVVFHNVLDVSAYNAFVVWRELNPGWLPGKLNKRRVFLERLGRALVAPLMERRERPPRAEASAAVLKAVRGGGGAEGPGDEPEDAGQ